MKNVLPIFWKSYNIQKVCHSSKEAETKNILKLVDKSLYQAKMVEQVLFGNNRKVRVDLYTDSQALIDSIVSSRQVDGKMLRPIIADMMEKLIDREAISRQFEDVVAKNIYTGLNVERHKVMYNGSEVKLYKN